MSRILWVEILLERASSMVHGAVVGAGKKISIRYYDCGL